MYQAFIDDSNDEFELWKQRWHAAAEPPKTALGAHTACSASLYPNLSILLQVLVTLPVTTATAERSFSTPKRLKTYLRSSMRDERLTSLALIHVHAQTTPVEPVEVVDIPFWEFLDPPLVALSVTIRPQFMIECLRRSNQ